MTVSNMVGGPAQPAQAALIARPPQVRLVPPERNEATLSRSSSVYSNYSLPHSIAPGPENPLPGRPLPEPESYYKIMRDNSTSRAQRKSQRRERSDTMFSHDSATTIASSTSGAMDGIDDFSAFPEPPHGQQGSLSPVVESPHSGGTSPVTYPKIPRPRSGSNKAAPGLKLFPPAVKYEYTPAGQPSPTLGLANLVNTDVPDVPVPPSQQGLPSQQQPYSGVRRPGLNPFPNRNPGQVRNGSPNMPQEENNGAMPQPLSISTGGGSGNGGWSRPMMPPQPEPTPDEQSVVSPSVSLHSNASSLLAKRLGADRAAALAMGEGNGKKAPPAKWKRQQGPGTPGFLVDDTHVPLPATPGWQPKLTPTRRGDDLFLSVQ
ncbi:hypothetical protein UCRPA7_321 [Phaeoacremonium minimum UCRPA7]|uniref:Uncharacterized protein n=1 Tax=Phaeoacremonium minimum (strain UCR-PA7) TaxID=1286976 RepID=R8BXT5_PHAM7|nr:hypothetical protein UCRPA7_321 [Phaeoacremonium minimum UCRPA7]EOO04152.1 hypothetical protein UCRPA7_321 [Phaeoacremonium minimum UCRPA7]